MSTEEPACAAADPEADTADNDSEEEEDEEYAKKVKLVQENPAFYTDAAAYWNNVPATVNGMLGGFAHINAPDICGSEIFLQSIFKMKNAPGHGRAVDCGAGIGRITKHLLQKHFGKVDLVEQCQSFLDRAKESLKSSPKVGEYLCQGLQHFAPEPGTYDVVWSQWVLGHLTDEDLENFFRRMARGLKPNGVVVVKENVTSSGIVELDEQDSSVTRPESLLLEIIDKAALRVIKNTKQNNLPKGLYEVKMLCLRPK
ncbi:N-terminal Xaa-Pro-Lys N-methyltransferase 1-like [Portunus trituberculatus]|nr:N-terminal Xaa-Pro-Lys N-methyltransferase 1-like [Portunus trituberculatus]XP_045113412.1 N-terminal Xaa-Pro-Lys N-methyltransferase 1-like [Portunus trituberculatus]